MLSVRWGDGIVRIATAHEADGGDYTGIATKHVEDLYAYDRQRSSLQADDGFD
jgi:hypothetical protein